MNQSNGEAERQNQALWDELAPIHLAAYREVAMLREGQEILDEIELRDLGDVSGQSLLHLQCHIGTDSLAWTRHGAVVTGVDFSTESLVIARQLAQELGLPARFIHSNVFDLRDVLEEQFDLVYTSKGVLCWLRNLDEWAHIVAHHLKPGGRFYLMETHPIAATLEGTADAVSFTYPYFHQSSPMEWAGDGDYADPTYVSDTPSLEWQWMISDILNALVGAGLRIDSVGEYDRLFFKMLPGMTTDDGRWYRLPGYETKIPLLLTIRASKPS